MVAAVANVDGDATEFSFEDRMSKFAFHLKFDRRLSALIETIYVVSRLVEVADSRNVVFARLADDDAARRHDHRRVPEAIA